MHIYLKKFYTVSFLKARDHLAIPCYVIEMSVGALDTNTESWEGVAADRDI
jgi:hypothetical protein